MSNKAFLVGINDYAPVGAGGSDLNGCVSDAEDIHIDYEPLLKIVWLLKGEGNKREIASGLNHTLWAGCKDN
jgi:hypothetical protein